MRMVEIFVLIKIANCLGAADWWCMAMTIATAVLYIEESIKKFLKEKSAE